MTTHTRYQVQQDVISLVYLVLSLLTLTGILPAVLTTVLAVALLPAYLTAVQRLEENYDDDQ